ncbi:MAG: DNA mismatch repair endonuclease MutL [Chloroflexota bacterium]
MIRRLSPGVAARIAAGEVVERPASVVKELIENALDAGATRIAVEIEGGGLDLIRVTDDGAGIIVADLPVAFERHATSKLTSDADLERIETLGFRGEALPSIAAVADVDCLTGTTDAPHAWLLTLRSGEISEIEPATRTHGTTMTVRSLFGELPARRKFMRGKSGENGQIVTQVANVALSRPSVAFSLRLDGRRALETPGEGSLAAAMVAVHGKAMDGHFIEIEPDEADGHGVEIRGCLGWGQATLPTRAGLTLLINGRWVQSRALSFAVDEAYRTLVQVGRYPVAVLDITVPPGDVDVNVHPRKSEVRLVRERAVFGAIQRAIRRTLAGLAGPQPSGLLAPDDQFGPERDGAGADGGWTSGLRVLGQAGNTYIIAEGRAGVYLVDQHAAHERVLLERIEAAGHHSERSQLLLEPQPLELPPRVAAIAREHLESLRATGFDLEPFGDDALLVRAVPADLARVSADGSRSGDPFGVLRATLSSLADEAPPPDWRHRIATLCACHAAVRAGDRLTGEEMTALLEQLGEAELCHVCSHGRPTAILLSHHQLAREFGRLY